MVGVREAPPGEATFAWQPPWTLPPHSPWLEAFALAERSNRFAVRSPADPEDGWQDTYWRHRFRAAAIPSPKHLNRDRSGIASLLQAAGALGHHLEVDKEYILQEIRRTAKGNGGSPLGIQRFEAETGIKRGAWYGVYWRRWGDALAEAGFAPNELQGAYVKEDLLGQYANLAKQLGRVPVSADLRMHARDNPGFPAHTTFANQFGSKADLLKQLQAFCEQRQGFEDVLRLCDGAWSAARIAASAASGGANGFVYLVKSGRFYKIGRSNLLDADSTSWTSSCLNGRRRFTSSEPMIRQASKRTGNKRFDSKRKNGEWFQLGADDITAFRRRKFM